MKIFSDLGFEPVFFAAQIINFLILAYLFKRFLYKPVLKVLHEREQKIAQGLKDAEGSRVQLEESEQKKDEIIRKAALEAEKIIDETKKNALNLKLELAASAKKEADKIIREAVEAARLEFERAQRHAQENTIELSRKLLEKIIGEIFTREEKEKIVQRNIKRLEEYGKS